MAQSLVDEMTWVLRDAPLGKPVIDLVPDLVRAVHRAGYANFDAMRPGPQTVEDVYALAATDPQTFKRWATDARTLLASILMVDTTQFNTMIVNAVLQTQED